MRKTPSEFFSYFAGFFRGADVRQFTNYNTKVFFVKHCGANQIEVYFRDSHDELHTILTVTPTQLDITLRDCDNDEIGFINSYLRNMFALRGKVQRGVIMTDNNGDLLTFGHHVRLDHNGVWTALDKPLARTFIKEKHRELLKLIRDVRYDLRIRSKLGVLDKFTAPYLRNNHAELMTWQRKRNITALQDLKAVSSEDYTTYLPLLARLVDRSWWSAPTGEKWVEEYEKFLTREKERLLIESGSVIYC